MGPGVLENSKEKDSSFDSSEKQIEKEYFKMRSYRWWDRTWDRNTIVH